MNEQPWDDPVEIPINGELDLHAFQPREVKPLLRDYIEACLEKNLTDLRIVHGKGRGVLRDTVHSVLAKMPQVAWFQLAGTGAGGWGATVVKLHPPGAKPE